jgi:hypothetical protein
MKKASKSTALISVLSGASGKKYWVTATGGRVSSKNAMS